MRRGSEFGEVQGGAEPPVPAAASPCRSPHAPIQEVSRACGKRIGHLRHRASVRGSTKPVVRGGISQNIPEMARHDDLEAPSMPATRQLQDYNKER